MTAGIRTEYRLTSFRSRAEARWAAFFDGLEWRWTYEPLDAGGYLPDFLIHGDRPFFVEVGPCITRSDFDAKAAKPDAAVEALGRDLLIVGVDPIVELGSSYRPTAGLLGEFGQWLPSDADNVEELQTMFSWGLGEWVTCAECGLAGVTHEFQSFAVRPCGHYSSGRDLDIGAPFLQDSWARATNQVQWMADLSGDAFGPGRPLVRRKEYRPWPSR